MEYKASTPQTKAAGEGKATVVIATLGVKDRDGDVLLPGAFGEQIVPVVPAHDWKSYHIGKARIVEHGTEAVAEIEFYLTTEAGKNWYAAIKEDFDRPPTRQQYSWGFSTTSAHVKHGPFNGEHVRFLKATDDGQPLPIHEVSPVLVGAGHNTRSVAVKEDQARIEDTLGREPLLPIVPVIEAAESKGMRIITPHTTLTDDRVWNSAIVQQQIKATGTSGYFCNFYTIQDEGLDGVKSNYRLLHHFPGKDGQPGPASTRACSLYIEALNKGYFAPAHRQALYDHWAGHLKDAGLPVPELGPVDSYLYPFDEESKHVFWTIEAAMARLEAMRDIRARKGMALTQARLDQFKSLQERVAAFCLLVDIKHLNQPTEAVLAQMGSEAKAEAMAQKLEAMQTRVRTDTEAAERAMTEEAAKRILAKLEAARS